jgi:hypothetical protein
MVIVDYYASKLGKSTGEVLAAALILRTPVDGEPDRHAFTALAWDEDLLGPKPSDEDLAKIDAMPAPEPVVVLYRADLYRRCTDDEADKIDAALAKQPTRIRRIFESAVAFRSDDDFWPTLRDTAVGLFKDKRADELLAAST